MNPPKNATIRTAMSESIVAKITLLFIFSSICFVLFALYFIGFEASRNEAAIEQRYSSVVAGMGDLFKFGYDVGAMKGYLLDLGFSQVKDSERLAQLSQKRFLSSVQGKQFIINSKKIAGHYYIITHDMQTNSEAIYTDYNEERDFLGYYVVALLAFITLVFFYILVLRSLLPLRSLVREVRAFANGKTDIKPIANSRDEIGELSREFSHAAQTIGEMNKARVLFLRSIMHELKTPITKGRLIAEMLSDNRAKERLVSTFTRLNAIIDDFAKIEEMSTKNYHISKTRFSLSALMENINKMLLIEDERPRNVLLHNRNGVIFADFEAMSLSVKNLVDNAIKHSTNQLVFVYIEGCDLVVKNEGEAFKDHLANYFQPFYSDGRVNLQKGLGLGMYIIKNTIEAQGFRLDYRYDGGFHYFYIRGCALEAGGESGGESSGEIEEQNDH